MARLPWRWIFIVLVVFGAWKYWSAHSLKAAPGILALNDPVQTAPAQKRIYQKGKYELEVLAEFNIEARVLSKESYSNDRESELAEIDLALGWGAMSDSAVLAKLSISQGSRFYFYHWDDEPPLPPGEIIRHSANMHLIPANAEIRKAIKNVRVGQIVQIEGQLVEARSTDGWHWRSSLTRNDSGAGACEVVRVESISVR